MKGQAPPKIAMGYYRAADRNRLTSDWHARARSADAAIIPDRGILDARARDLCENDSYGRSIVRAYRRNIIGTGITGASSARDRAGALMKNLNRRIDALWFDWGRQPRLVDRERRRSLLQVQHWVMAELVKVGEAFIILGQEQRGSSSQYPEIVLQCVEAEQLDMLKLEHDGREVRGGVEIDECGAAVAYWIHPRNQNDYVAGSANFNRYITESVRIPAERMLHIYDPERVRQTRGVTMLAASARRLRDLGELDYSQLVGARGEANIGLIVEEQPVETIGMGSAGGDACGASEDGGGAGDSRLDDLPFEPLMVYRAKPGDKLTPFAPTRSSGNYEPFTSAQLKAVSAATGISLEQLRRDFSTSNYSGLRQGALEDRRENATMMELLYWQFMQPIREEFIQLAVLQGLLDGLLDLGEFFADPDRFTYTIWRPQGHDWVDPEKEMKGIETALNLGLTTLAIEAAQRGHDWQELQQQRAVEREEIETLNTKPIKSPTSGDQQADAPSENVEKAPSENAGVAVDSSERISGIDAERINALLITVSSGQSSPDVILEILIGMGFEEPKARKMVDNAKSFQPVFPQDEVTP